MALAKRDEGSKVNAEINVTPMADVMLVLLIIFMVVTPMLQKGVSVDMAQTQNPIEMQDADKEDAVLVAVMKDGTVFLGTEKIPAENLRQRVQDMLENRMDKTVFIKADARGADVVHHVVDVVDNIRSAGVDQLGLLTEQKKGAGSAPATTTTGAAPEGSQ
jgi:biopolymer transport protein ExbD/biopolymer transport protein TolR